MANEVVFVGDFQEERKADVVRAKAAVLVGVSVMAVGDIDLTMARYDRAMAEPFAFSKTAEIIRENTAMRARAQAWDRRKRLDRAVRQAVWDQSAFGTNPECRRLLALMARYGVGERMHRAILAFWHMPARQS
jgi:hypothetical protein